jgi:hypothetical protein
MTALPPQGWRPVPAGELDRLEGRLRWRRWMWNLITALAVTVAVGAVGLGTSQAISLLNQWTGPSQSKGSCCQPGGTAEPCSSK